eukprot:210303_1
MFNGRTKKRSKKRSSQTHGNGASQLIPMYNDKKQSAHHKTNHSGSYPYSEASHSQGYSKHASPHKKAPPPPPKRDSGRAAPPSKPDSVRSVPPPPPKTGNTPTQSNRKRTEFTFIEPTFRQEQQSSRSIINPQQFTFVEYDDDDAYQQAQAQPPPAHIHQVSPKKKKKRKSKQINTKSHKITDLSDLPQTKLNKQQSAIITRNERNDHFNTVSLPSSLNNEHNALQELHDLIILYQQAVHDVHQALVDVKETSQDVSYKIKSVTEQLHIMIDRREDELLEEITKKTASKVFALDSQFTKLKQRLMFCCEARDEAEELLTAHYENNGLSEVKTRKRDHSVSTVTNYSARKERIMAIVNKAKHDAKSEFEEELNRGTPLVATRFHIDHYDITQQLETLGTIIDDEPLQQYQIYPPAITKTKAFKKSVRIAIKCREKIDSECEHQVLSCQFEPQFVLSNEMDLKTERKNMRSNLDKRASIVSLPGGDNPNALNWESLGWIELNPAPGTAQMFGKSRMKLNELNAAMTLKDDSLPQWGERHSAPTMSNLQKLKKELDLDHIVTEYTKLITGLNEILNDANGKYVYLRVRMRKLVKFDEDMRNTSTRKHKRKKLKKHSRKFKSAMLDVDEIKKKDITKDEDHQPIWIESLFSRSVRLSMMSLPVTIEVDTFEDFDGAKQRKKKKKKKRKSKSSQHSVSSPKGSLYESDSEFSKQRRHSNYHIQDELYEPGVLLLEKSCIIWHDIVNNRETTISDAIPVAARSSCGMVVAHDVLVADDEEEEQKREVISDGGRYTSIMFRLGGTLNKKTNRSVDMLDLGTGMWSSLPSLKHARSQCPPALINGNIICAGGCGRKSKPLSSVELFDFECAKWTELSPLKQARWGHAAYVMYYEDNEAIPRTPSCVSSTHSGADSNETAKLMVAGGWSRKRKNLQTAELYDFSTNQWQSIAPMNVARSRCVAMEWTSIDRVGVIGGWADSTKVVEYYDSHKDCWYRLKDLNHEHIYPSCGLLSDQHLYAMNRYLESDAKAIINERKKQHLENNIHHKMATMRGRPAPFVLGSNDQLSCLELFDDRSDQWIILQTFTRSRDNIISMIECALPSNVTSTLTQRNRGLSRSSQTSQSSFGIWQRRGSKILGML